MRTGYAVDGTYKLFELAGENVDTFSVRIMWKDTVVTRDPRVIQHVLATGFSDFEKGPEAKLKYVQRLFVLNHNITSTSGTFKTLRHVWQRDIQY